MSTNQLTLTAAKALEPNAGGLLRWRQAIGIALVVLSTCGIGVVPTFAKIAFAGGSGTLTMIAARCILTAATCLCILWALRRPLAMPRRVLAFCWGLGVVYAAHVYALLDAVNFLPVNTVIVVFYSHPLMIALIAIFSGREAVSIRHFWIFIAALAGLALAVGFTFGALNLTGLALALAAAVFAAIVILGSARAMRAADALTVTFHMMLGASVVLAAITAISGTTSLPLTGQGWLGFAGVAVAYTIGTVAFFAAVPLLGAVRAVMISNLEPVLGVLFAMAVLGEAVGILQGIGIALVIGSIFATEILRHRPDRRCTAE